MKKNSKRHQENKKTVFDTKPSTLSDAIKKLKDINKTKFDETLDVAVVLNKEKSKGEGLSRGYSKLPHGTGKKIKIGVFASGDKIDEAKKAGADIVGADDLVEQISKGVINFDRCIATPDMMGVVGKVAKVLGPKGMMPNPKLGTVSANVADAVKRAKAGEVEFRVEKQGIIHAGLGKLSFDEKKLLDNLNAFVDAVMKAKPAEFKGNYVKKISVSSTMGPGVQVGLHQGQA